MEGEMRAESNSKPLSVKAFEGRAVSGKILNLFGKRLESFLCLEELNEIYDSSLSDFSRSDCNSSLFENILSNLGVELEVDDEGIDRIPAEGPLVVVANHPFGGLDGLALGCLLSKRRPEFRILVNSIISCFEAFRPWFLEVDVLDEESASSKNVRSLLQALRWIKDGGCLAVFPAGEVASWNWRSMRVQDPQWNSHAAALALRTGAVTLPVGFEGANGPLFQGAGLIHPRLRTLMLGRELWNKRERTIRAHVGEPITASKLSVFPSVEASTRFLRVSVDLLRNSNKNSLEMPSADNRNLQPLEQPMDPSILAREINLLPENAILNKKGNFSVFCIQSRDAPTVMQEIGRLRELTFRSVGEGTGHAADLDDYDDHYHQIFIWDEKARAIAGGYRVGVVPEILPQMGKKGMYAASQFAIRPSFYKAIGPAAELGRSFIPPEYQVKFSLLGLLWRGIGEFLNRRPSLRVLYGPVSISADYSQISRNLMVRYLRRNEWSPGMLLRARPKHRFRGSHLSPALKKWVREEGRRIDEVSALVSCLEPDGKGVPVLVKHYLKLNGSFVSFGVDPHFSDALDGLIVVDIHNMSDAQLKRYFGQEGFARIRTARIAIDNT